MNRILLLLLLPCAIATASSDVTVSPTEHKVDRNYEIGVQQQAYVGDPIVKVRDYYVQQASRPVLRADQPFTMKIPPFSTIRVGPESDWLIEGTKERRGIQYRLAKLDQMGPAFGLKFLITEDGRFEGSAINLGGSRMGFTYRPDPDNVRLLPVTATAVATAKGGTNFELVYFGTTGDAINIAYREYTPDDLARPAFSQNLVYSQKDRTIRFRDIVIEVASAGNQSITYTVVSDE